VDECWFRDLGDRVEGIVPAKKGPQMDIAFECNGELPDAKNVVGVRCQPRGNIRQRLGRYQFLNAVHKFERDLIQLPLCVSELIFQLHMQVYQLPVPPVERVGMSGQGENARQDREPTYPSVCMTEDEASNCATNGEYPTRPNKELLPERVREPIRHGRVQKAGLEFKREIV
jgi:hypothetical protein